MYAQELVTLATKQKKEIGLFKADIFKAFDTLSWGFLQQVLIAKGLPEEWIHCIMNAVLKGSSKVLLNSVDGKKINLKRGIRQGAHCYPIYSYLQWISWQFGQRDWYNWNFCNHHSLVANRAYYLLMIHYSSSSQKYSKYNSSISYYISMESYQD